MELVVRRGGGLFEFFFVGLGPQWVVVVEIIVEVEERLVGEFFDFAAVFLGGSSQSFLPFDKSANLYHLKQLVLVVRGDVFEVVGHQFCAHTIGNEPYDLECEGDGRLAHGDFVANFDGVRRLNVHAAYGDTAVFARVGGYGACFEYACGPEPFVDSNVVHC